MNNTDISLKHALTAVFKTIMILVLFTAVLLFAKDQSFAAGDQTGDPDAAALTVILDGETVRTFTHKDLSDIAAAEGSKSYNYSFWDDSPAFGKEENVHGPSVDAVLEAAEIRKEVKSNGTVSFEGINGETSILTGRQLLDDTRYYYPNGDMVRYSEGLVPEDAYKNAVEVKSLISLDEESGNGLFVGQAAPNDQNAVVLVKGISAGGTIRISTKAAPVCAAPVMDPGKGTWRPGKEISITPGNESGGHQIIYFSYGRTSSPGYGSILYNYGNEQNMVCRPKVPADGKTVYVCASVRSYGMQDGAVLKKMFYIGDALTVKVDGETKTYDLDELKPFCRKGPVSYSGYNSYPTFLDPELVTNDYADLRKIIEDAGGKPIESFTEDSVIKLTGGDGYDTSLTMGQLFGTKRYYYPNAESGTDTAGGKISETAYEGKVEVPAVIELDESDTLIFGQAEPNDQNRSEWVKYMLTRGVIEVSTSEAEKCGQVIASKPDAGSVIIPGTAIYFSMPAGSRLRDKVNYIIDPEEGEIPDNKCDLYNYAPYRYSTKDLPFLPEDLVNAPVISEPGIHTIAVKISAFGKKDGDVSILRYYVGSGVKADLKASAAAYNKIKLTWNKESQAVEYKLYRKKGSGTETLYKTFGPEINTFTDTGISTGTSYTYRIAIVVKDTDGADTEFRYSGNATAKTQLKTPAIRLRAGRRSITVRWGRISGANGYMIYRSTKKSSGFKRVKTITRGATVSFVNKNLKKGQRYYYKIRAYRTVSGKKVYSSYSAVKYIKAK